VAKGGNDWEVRLTKSMATSPVSWRQIMAGDSTQMTCLKKRSVSSNKRSTKRSRASAYHEAGHAVAMFELGLTPLYVTIDPCGDTLGGVGLRKERSPLIRIPGKEPSKSQVVRANRDMKIVLAGPLVEALTQGELPTMRSMTWAQNENGEKSGDFFDICRLAEFRYADADASTRFINRMMNRTFKMLNQPHVAEQIHALAAALVEQGTVDGRRARGYCRVIRFQQLNSRVAG
jgi:hypothetical protein